MENTLCAPFDGVGIAMRFFAIPAALLPKVIASLGTGFDRTPPFCYAMRQSHHAKLRRAIRVWL